MTPKRPILALSVQSVTHEMSRGARKAPARPNIPKRPKNSVIISSGTILDTIDRPDTSIIPSMPTWKERYEGVEEMTVAVMGCIVNGPGESKAANIGISLPGTGEAPNCPVYVDGELATTLRGTYEELSAGLRALIDEYVESRYGARESVDA